MACGLVFLTHPCHWDVCRIEEGSTNAYLRQDRAVEEFLLRAESPGSSALLPQETCSSWHRRQAPLPDYALTATNSCSGAPPIGPTARLLKWSSTNRRIAEDRLPCWRAVSISPTSSDSVMLRIPEISFMLLQNASSSLTLSCGRRQRSSASPRVT